jgi:hypothetical protein
MRLQEARLQAPWALAAPIAHVIALAALAALALSRPSFYETFHADGRQTRRRGHRHASQCSRQPTSSSDYPSRGRRLQSASRRCAIGIRADPRPATCSTGPGSYEEDGGRVVARQIQTDPDHDQIVFVCANGIRHRAPFKLSYG